MVKEQCFVFGRIFITWQSRKGIFNLSKIFLEKNGIKLPYIEEKKIEFARFKTIASRMSLEYSGFPKENLLGSLTYGQTWLIPLLEDC